MDSKTGGEKQRQRERDKWTTRECLRGRERQERCLHLLIHAERTCLCLWALGDVLKAAVMNAALFSHTSLISASLSAILLSADPGRAVPLFTLVVVLKMSGIKNKFAVLTAQIWCSWKGKYSTNILPSSDLLGNGVDDVCHQQQFFYFFIYPNLNMLSLQYPMILKFWPNR